MKKLFTTVLCFLFSFCIVLSAGCDKGAPVENKADFGGNFVKAEMDKLSAFSSSVALEQKSLDVNSGVKFEYIENEVDGNEVDFETVEFNTAMVDGKLIMAGKVTENDDKRESGDVYYDGENIYFKPIKGKNRYTKTSFNNYFARMLNQLNGYNLDSVILMFKNSEGVNFYMEEGADFTKVKVEFEGVKFDDGRQDERITGKILFTYNAEKMLKAVNIDIREEELGRDAEYDQTIINVEPYSGAVELPTDLNTYSYDYDLDVPW